MKSLLILRHAKSSWKEKGVADHDRSLSKRGKRDAPRVGRFLRERNIVPELILCSTAKRARKTAGIVSKESRFKGRVEHLEEFYGAEVKTFFRVLQSVSDKIDSIMIVGHNPDLELFLRKLTGETATLPTAALASVSLDIDCWSSLRENTQSRLENLWRPKDLLIEVDQAIPGNSRPKSSVRTPVTECTLLSPAAVLRGKQSPKLEEFVCRQVVTLKPSDSIQKAVSRMDKHDIRHLPVVDDDSPVGMVSDRDLVSSVGWSAVRNDGVGTEESSKSSFKTVAEIMTTPIRTLPIDESMQAAAGIMLRQKISAVPVTSKNQLAGIVTESDFLRCYLDESGFPGGTSWRKNDVGHYMRKQVITLRPDQTAMSAFRLMREHWLRHLPVVENNRLVGIVSERDVRRSFYRTMNNALSESGETERSVIRHIMNPDVCTASPEMSLPDAARRMLENRIGALPVINDGELAGIITETDLLFVTCDP